MIINYILIVIILLLLSTLLYNNSKREGLSQVMQNKNNLKKLNDDYNSNSIIEKEVSNLEKMENVLQKNIKKFLDKLTNMTYSTMNTSKNKVPNPLPTAPAYMFD